MSNARILTQPDFSHRFVIEQILFAYCGALSALPVSFSRFMVSNNSRFWVVANSLNACIGDFAYIQTHPQQLARRECRFRLPFKRLTAGQQAP